MTNLSEFLLAGGIPWLSRTVRQMYSSLLPPSTSGSYPIDLQISYLSSPARYLLENSCQNASVNLMLCSPTNLVYTLDSSACFCSCVKLVFDIFPPWQMVLFNSTICFLGCVHISGLIFFLCLFSWIYFFHVSISMALPHFRVHFYGYSLFKGRCPYFCDS